MGLWKNLGHSEMNFGFENKEENQFIMKGLLFASQNLFFPIAMEFTYLGKSMFAYPNLLSGVV